MVLRGSKHIFQIFSAHGRLKVGGVRGRSAYFPIAVFLTNVKHCLEASQESHYFNVTLPSFEEYMSRLKFPKFFDRMLINPERDGVFYSRLYESLNFSRLEDLIV